MTKAWAGITAGLLAGAAGASAKNAVSYLDQAVQGDSPATSPSGPVVTETAAHATSTDSTRSAALGPLTGLGIGAGIGAVAGLIRGSNVTPPPVPAAVITGLVAMGVGNGLAGAASSGRTATPKNLVRDLISHLAYGAVTGYALHRMLDPHTPDVARFNPFS